MAKKNQAAESKAESQRPKKQNAGLTPDAGVDPAGLTAMSNGAILRFGAGSTGEGRDELTNARWLSAQRQTFAHTLSRLQGNRSIQRAIDGADAKEAHHMGSSSSPAASKRAAGDRGSYGGWFTSDTLDGRGSRGMGTQAASPPANPGANNNGNNSANLSTLGSVGPPSNRTPEAPPPPPSQNERTVRPPQRLVTHPGLEGLKSTARDPVVAAGLVEPEAAKGVVQRQGGGGGSSAPIPALPDAERRHSLALDVLKKAYGGRIKKETKVNGTANESQLRTMYDIAMIAMGRVFVESDGTERAWMPGDSLKHPAMSTELSGFFDPKSGQVYIDLSKKPDAQVATLAHELLHASSSADFVATLGKDLDEGMTEKLTQEAFAKSGFEAPTGFFAGQIAVVGRISALVGENTMKNAYFNGTGGLRSMMDARLGEGIFERFAIEVRHRNWGWLDKFFERYATAIKGTETEKKVAAINSLLDGWVSDTDLDNIENIWSASSKDEKAEIAKSIRPRVGSLIDLGQRARLRGILAS